MLQHQYPGHCHLFKRMTIDAQDTAGLCRVEVPSVPYHPPGCDQALDAGEGSAGTAWKAGVRKPLQGRIEYSPGHKP